MATGGIAECMLPRRVRHPCITDMNKMKGGIWESCDDEYSATLMMKIRSAKPKSPQSEAARIHRLRKMRNHIEARKVCVRIEHRCRLRPSRSAIFGRKCDSKVVDRLENEFCHV